MSNESPLLIEQAAVVGQNVSVSMNFLDNLARENLEVREVRIVATPVDANGAPVLPKDPDGVPTIALDAAKILGLAAMLDFGLRLQSTYLTVPRRVPAEMLRSPFFDSLSEPEDSTTLTTTEGLQTIPQRAIIWTFPEPLFVPAGAKMYAELFYNAGEAANSFMWDRLLVQVTLVAQRVGNKAMPEKSRIPYATTFRTPKQQVDSLPQEFVGQDFQLKNHCKEPLCVQRLTAYNTGADRIPTSVRYSTSQGRFINRQLAPILELHSNGALNLNTILEPNEFIAVEGVLEGEPAAAGVLASYEQQAIFGLVGYREVDTAVLWSDALRDVTPGQPISPVAPPVLPYVVDLPPVKSRLPELPLPRTPQPPYTPWKKW